MNLTSEDFLQIRQIFEEVAEEKIVPLRGDIQALTNDIKEIYSMISALQKDVGALKKGVAVLKAAVLPSDEFEQLTTEQKIIRAYKDILAVAKQAGVTLPR